MSVSRDNRDKALESIRPELDIPSGLNTGEVEQFQNQTLRPILKFQNDFLHTIFETQLVKRKMKIDTDSKKTVYDSIEKVIKKDISFKNALLFSILSLMTSEEVVVFRQSQSEYSKRIINMIIQRLASHYIK